MPLFNSGISNKKKPDKTGSRLQKNSANKYYQIAKPDKFEFNIKF